MGNRSGSAQETGNAEFCRFASLVMTGWADCLGLAMCADVRKGRRGDERGNMQPSNAEVHETTTPCKPDVVVTIERSRFESDTCTRVRSRE